MYKTETKTVTATIDVDVQTTTCDSCGKTIRKNFGRYIKSEELEKERTNSSMADVEIRIRYYGPNDEALHNSHAGINLCPECTSKFLQMFPVLFDKSSEACHIETRCKADISGKPCVKCQHHWDKCSEKDQETYKYGLLCKSFVEKEETNA